MDPSGQLGYMKVINHTLSKLLWFLLWWQKEQTILGHKVQQPRFNERFENSSIHLFDSTILDLSKITSVVGIMHTFSRHQ